MNPETDCRATRESEDYRVGPDGSVWSRLIKGSKTGRTGPWRRLKCCLHDSGRGVYQKVTLRVNGKSIPRYVHHLVLEAFAGPCPDGMEACHGDGDPLNNSVSNLRWDTHQSNVGDTVAMGRVPRGESHHATRLTESDVVGIVEVSRAVPAATQKEIAELFGADVKTVKSILCGANWGWLTGIAREARPKGRPPGRRQRPLRDLGAPDLMPN